MKLTLSNIAWPETADAEVFTILRERGVRALEIAPTRIWPDWRSATVENAAVLRKRLADAGFSCSSLQSILYGRPDLRLFGTGAERSSLAQHLRHVADLAVALGAVPMVLGAPKNRERGALDDERAFDIAVPFFAELGAYCADRGVLLGLEPNPTNYGCDFITNSREGAALVRAVGSPGFRLHLDAAGMHLAGEDSRRAIEDNADILAHIHVSEPFLGNFAEPAVDHRRIAAALRTIKWDDWISIEMRATESPAASVREAVSYVMEVYRPR